ncbi:hypothetical protein M378DRAFT_77855 [Amanita muscaria Koide BX008]|uniref:Prolyl 4-hydroxylase alpha subunit domain-containing protein n=1 Tax=Amanita muscaria (strain Koide BX008) TaxID=946122 RepID=A0A0C2TD94_AMAMK|nr:hypothetical protein M378DRAFT_77855 [Amanita muscaria Koide BX008]
MSSSSAPLLDFSSTPLAKDYPPDQFYIKVLDDVFTPDECRALITFAETGLFNVTEHINTEVEDPWKPAAVHYGLQAHQQYVDKEYRNSERILRFDHDVAAFIYNRLLPYIHEVVEIKPGDKWHGVVGLKSPKVWRMVGVNERLSFLKYGPGHFFKEHCDGRPELPDGRKSQITLQIYLNGSDSAGDKIVGGPTRIWSWDKKRWHDVEPRMGRVLIFQQAMVLHSGEEVKEGVKYAVRSDFMYRTE